MTRPVRNTQQDAKRFSVSLLLFAVIYLAIGYALFRSEFHLFKYYVIDGSDLPGWLSIVWTGSAFKWFAFLYLPLCIISSFSIVFYKEISSAVQDYAIKKQSSSFSPKYHTPKARAANSKFVGELLLGLGGFLVFVSFLLNDAVGDTYNIGLLANKAGLLQLGGFLMVVGAVFQAGSLVANAISAKTGLGEPSSD